MRWIKVKNGTLLNITSASIVQLSDGEDDYRIYFLEADGSLVLSLPYIDKEERDFYYNLILEQLGLE
jgi:hypothetical protein